MPEVIRVSAVIHASPKRIYEAWLSSEEHSAFTGGMATVEPTVGGRHTAWEGYTQGTILELEPYRRIVQSWRTSEFPPDSPDSRLEVLLQEIDGGTRVTLLHSDIPEGQAEQYRQGWKEFYFEPMKRYFPAGATKSEVGMTRRHQSSRRKRGQA